MSKNRITAIVLVVVFCLCACGSLVAGVPPAVRPGNNELAARGFNELYNMDYDPAIRDLSKLQSEYPNDPFPSNYLLAAVLFKELNRIGALNTELYLGEGFLTSKARRPLDAGVRKQIFDLIARVESQCDARLEKNPRDTDALYARGVARGFRAMYMGMAEKSWLAAIRAALSSRRDHERVLEIDPSYVDAKMTVGIHNYIVGSLNWAGRAAVAMVGVTGNKQKGLDYLREVSRSHGTARNDATMALSLFLGREQRYQEALQLVSRISREYPRNFILAFENAHLLNAAGHGREAIAQYQTILEKGREGKFSTFQPEVVAWGLGVSARGQHEFAQAASAFDMVTTFRNADPVLIDRATVAAGEMYDTLGRRDQAIAHYRRAIASGHDGEPMAAARKHLRHPYHFSE